jgi:hypothetical protein
MSIRWTSMLAALVCSRSMLLTVTYIYVAHFNGPPWIIRFLHNRSVVRYRLRRMIRSAKHIGWVK